MKVLALSPKSVPRKSDVNELLDTPDSENGRTPLQVMLATMNFYDRQAERLLKQLERLVVRADDPQSRAEAQETLRAFLITRDKAQACARDAAPFCHGRVGLTNESPLPSQRQPQPEVDWDHITPAQAAAAYRRICRAARGK